MIGAAVPAAVIFAESELQQGVVQLRVAGGNANEEAR
jgi:hypothetical protein